MSNRGFTLVEVIVVSVVLAVLALAGVQIYVGYVEDAKKQTLDHCAASAAQFLTTAVNLDKISEIDKSAELTAPNKWEITIGSGATSAYSPPEGVTIRVVETNKVEAERDGALSERYQFQ